MAKKQTNPKPQHQQDGGSAQNNNEQHFYTLNKAEALKHNGPRSMLGGSGGNLSDADGSGRSGSSAFSSNSSSDEYENVSEHERSSESLSQSSSGRCSSAAAAAAVPDGQPAAEPLPSDVEASKWNFVPQRVEALALIEQVRARFLDSLKDPAEVDELDLAELRKPLPSHTDADQLYQSLAVRLIGRFINFGRLLEAYQEQQDQSDPADSKRSQQQTSASASVEKQLGEASEKLREFLVFRHNYQVCHLLVDQFCKEIHQLHGIFPFGYDKNKLPVLYLRARVHRRWSHRLDETFKRYVAWQVDLMTKSYHGAKCVKSISDTRNIKDGSFGICFDCLNVSYACVDMDLLSYLVKILVQYYPTYCRYALCVDLPWLFRSVWKLVRSWLPEEAQKTVHLITSKQLVEFIDEDQIPNSMKINDLAGCKKSARGKHKLPAEFESLKNFDEYAQELKLSASEIKQFKNHMEKVLKEYEQLGAV